MPKFEKYLYGNGGKIISVQVENEYGAFGVCDKQYINFLRDETEKYVKGNAILFTTDRPILEELECGQIDNVFVTTDFGISTQAEVDQHFEILRKVQKTGPLVNSEFYTGWLTHWQEPNARRSAYDLAATLRRMLDLKVNVNFYMFFGGTNFGFWAGANDWGIGKYMADITSYDYDAPLDEAGDTTLKYDILLGAISDYFEIPNVIPFTPIKKVALKPIQMSPVDTIFSDSGRQFLASRPRQEKKLLTFEELDQFSGFVLYETELPKLTRDPSNLIIEDLRDRAQVYVDKKIVGVLSRENLVKSLPISAGSGSKLQILVENQGRINFQIADDFKVFVKVYLLFKVDLMIIS
jgi:beta-galactosidase